MLFMLKLISKITAELISEKEREMDGGIQKAALIIRHFKCIQPNNFLFVIN